MGGRTPCNTCHSAHRARIEFALARGVGIDALARRYGIHRDAIYRHKCHHMPPRLMDELKAKSLMPVVELEKLRTEESSGLLEHLIAQRAGLYNLIRQCEEAGGFAQSVMAHRALTSNLKVTGDLLNVFASHGSVTQNIIVSPEYLKLRQKLLQALAPFPEARRAVLAALRSVEVPEPGPKPVLTIEDGRNGDQHAD